MDTFMTIASVLMCIPVLITRIPFTKRVHALPVNLLLAIIVTGFTLPCAAQSLDREISAPERVIVEDGVMYWENSHEEVALVGANYMPAYADAYIALQRLGKDHKEAIREDAYHFARLGLEAYRVHMFYNEITDSQGNILRNEHLDIHDYTIYQMSQRDIKTIITPLVGFNATFAYSDRAMERHKNYLKQLITHVNPYSGKMAIDDPYIIALEITNEPRHSGYERTLEIVNDFVAFLRENGWKKPIFYNISHNFEVTDAFLDSNINGVTFQWYPAGLVGNRTIKKNYFPYVNNYPIPWSDDERFKNKAQIVYEFSPADTLFNYALPMMARSFRQAGMQIATQFAYDPLAIAHANTNYETHFLNMVYTPNKAVSIRIASEVFKRVKLNQQFNDYPADTTFGDFLFSHRLNLSQMNAEDEFLYSNNTDTPAKKESALKRLAGVGSSPVVSYPGTGAYFLDKLEDGIWRLEVMPDAIQVHDPFERPDLYRHVVHINWREHLMWIKLSNLGDSFTIKGLNEGNQTNTSSDNGSFNILPGTYLLTRNGVSSEDWTAKTWMGRIQLGEYYAVPTSAKSPEVWHTPFEKVEAGKPLTITANVVGLNEGDSVLLQVDPFIGRSQSIRMREVSPYRFEAAIPAEAINPGGINYWIFVDQGDEKFISFPGGNPGHIPVVSWQRDYYHNEHWSTQIVTSGSPLGIWDAQKDYLKTETGFEGRGIESILAASKNPDKLSWKLSSQNPTSDRNVLGLATYIGNRLSGISSATLDSYNEIVIRAKTDYPLPSDFKVVLVDNNANSYSASVPLTKNLEEHHIRLDSLKPDRFMLLPRPYPTFLESWFATGMPGPIKTSDIEEIQFLIDTSEVDNFDGQRYGFEIESVWL